MKEWQNSLQAISETPIFLCFFTSPLGRRRPPRREGCVWSFLPGLPPLAAHRLVYPLPFFGHPGFGFSPFRLLLGNTPFRSGFSPVISVLEPGFRPDGSL